jgi:hypothetical protein
MIRSPGSGTGPGQGASSVSTVSRTRHPRLAGGGRRPRGRRSQHDSKPATTMGAGPRMTVGRGSAAARSRPTRHGTCRRRCNRSLAGPSLERHFRATPPPSSGESSGARLVSAGSVRIGSTVSEGTSLRAPRKRGRPLRCERPEVGRPPRARAHSSCTWGCSTTYWSCPPSPSPAGSARRRPPGGEAGASDGVGGQPQNCTETHLHSDGQQYGLYATERASTK